MAEIGPKKVDKKPGNAGNGASRTHKGRGADAQRMQEEVRGRVKDAQRTQADARKRLAEFPFFRALFGALDWPFGVPQS